MKYLGIDIARILLFYMKSHLRVLFYYARYMALNRQILKKTRAVKMSARGRRAFVFANGPSLAKLDPVKIAGYQRSGYDVIAINSYINSEFAKVVAPNCYVLSDPACLGINMGDLSTDLADQYRQDFLSVTNSGTKLFLPLQYYRGVQYVNKYAFCDAENFYSSNVRDILRPRGYLSQTAFKAMSLAHYLGYEKIFLCGLDNNYFKTVEVDDNNNIFFADRHFYAENEALVRRSIQDLMGRRMSMGELLYTFHFNFKHLEKFKKLPIINLDKTGLVDSFDKKHDLDVYIE